MSIICKLPIFGAIIPVATCRTASSYFPYWGVGNTGSKSSVFDGLKMSIVNFSLREKKQIWGKKSESPTSLKTAGDRGVFKE